MILNYKRNLISLKLYNYIINGYLIKFFKSGFRSILREIMKKIKDPNESCKMFVVILTLIYDELFPKNKIKVKHSNNSV